MTTDSIGFLGLGRMGGAFALRLRQAGHQLDVWNRTPSKAVPLAEAGARVVETKQDLAGNRVVFVSVMSDPDLLAVTTGPEGILTRPDGVAPPVLVDLSTVSTTASAAVRAACEAVGTRFLAAPVSGNHEAVLAGRASFAVSGPYDVFAGLDLFEQMGTGAVWVGDAEEARMVKLGHNLLAAVIVQALVETLTLVEKSGVSRSAFLSFVNGSALASTFTRYKAPTLVNLDYDPRFTTRGLLKDVDLGMDEARRLGVPLALVGTMRPLLQSAIGHGWAEDDFNRLLDLQALGADLQLRSEDLAIDDGLGSRP